MAYSEAPFPPDSPDGNDYAAAAPDKGDSTRSQIEKFDQKIGEQLGKPDIDWAELARLQQQRQELQREVLGTP